MGEILTFALRPKQAAPELPGPVSPSDLRAEIEAGAQAALDVADRFIAILDRLDGDDAELSSAAPENAAGAHVVYMLGTDQDRWEEVPAAVLPEMTVEPTPEPQSEPLSMAEILPWRGRGNFIAAAGTMLLDLLERA